jgi:hypothetical protein
MVFRQRGKVKILEEGNGREEKGGEHYIYS